MKRRVAFLTLLGLLAAMTAAWSETALAFVTPKNLKDYGFRLTSKAWKNDTVEFVIRRDVRNIDGPGTAGYLSKAEDKSIGTPVKLHEGGKTLEFRFSVPADQLATTVFTLWGQGARGEGITFRFKLQDFPATK
jgi:hypothetical protein